MRRNVLSALALVLTLGVVATASAANQTYSLAGKNYEHNAVRANGEKVVERLEFDSSGNFTLTLDQVMKGKYEVIGDTLKLTYQGNVFDLKIISHDDSSLVIYHSSLGQIKYVLVQ